MLDPADIVAAKILNQLGWVPLGVLQGLLRESQRQGQHSDLVGRLDLSAEHAAWVRACTARFQVVFFEASYLRELERRGLQPEEAVELLASVEREGHQVRLSTLAHRFGRFTAQTLWEVEEITLRNVRAQDAAVVQRYVAQDFAGVGRPLVVDAQITDATFRVSRIFRDAQTHARVLRCIAEQQVLDQDTDKINVDELSITGELEIDVDLAPFRLRGAQGERRQVPESIGDYRVLQCLGAGGMGAVYLAEIGVGQIVAVKTLLPGASADDQARFEREATISRLIDHPCVVRLLDAGVTAEGVRYMVMPPYPCTSLRTLLKRDEVPLQLAFVLLEQLFDALAAVHTAGVVHRDVKPENVLVLAGSEQVKLVDFGIARFYRGPGVEDVYHTKRGVITGSPAFMAPETIMGEPSTPATDLYAAGVVCMLLLTGRPPFEGERPVHYVEHHMYSVPPTLSEQRPDLYWCPELEMLQASLLAKAAKDRPKSASEVRDLLRGGLTARSLQLLKRGRAVDLHSSFEL